MWAHGGRLYLNLATVERVENRLDEMNGVIAVTFVDGRTDRITGSLATDVLRILDANDRLKEERLADEDEYWRSLDEQAATELAPEREPRPIR